MGPTNNRVTRCSIEDSIAYEHYIIAGDAITEHVPTEAVRTHLGCLTFCIIVLDNGFTVTGESACADPANFDEKIGQRVAREKAIEKLWPLLGFRLRDRMAQVEKAYPASVEDQTTHVGSKVVHALPMTRGAYNALRGWDCPEDEDPADEGFLVEYADGGSPNVEGFDGYVSWSPKGVFERAYGDPVLVGNWGKG